MFDLAGGVEEDPVHSLCIVRSEVQNETSNKMDAVVSLFSTSSREEIKGQKNKGKSGKEKNNQKENEDKEEGLEKGEAGCPLKSWVSPVFFFVTVILNAATLILLLILTLPEKTVDFDGTKVFLVGEVVLFCCINLMYCFSTCTICNSSTFKHCYCGCSPDFVTVNLGFLLVDSSRVACFVFQSFVCICTGSLIGYVMGGCLAANGLAQALALSGIGCFYESPSDMKLGDPSVTETANENASTTADNASTTAGNAASPSLKTPEAGSVESDSAAESV